MAPKSVQPLLPWKPSQWGFARREIAGGAVPARQSSFLCCETMTLLFLTWLWHYDDANTPLPSPLLSPQHNMTVNVAGMMNISSERTSQKLCVCQSFAHNDFYFLLFPSLFPCILFCCFCLSYVFNNVFTQKKVGYLVNSENSNWNNMY